MAATLTPAQINALTALVVAARRANGALRDVIAEAEAMDTQSVRQQDRDDAAALSAALAGIAPVMDSLAVQLSSGVE